MNIIEVLQELRIDYREHGTHKNVRAGWIGLQCRSCTIGKSGDFKLGVPVNGFVAVCWTCGKRRLTDTLVELSGRPWQEVKKLLGGLERQAFRTEERRGKLVPPKGLGPLQGVHRKYLRARGFDPDELERLWGVQGIDFSGGRLAWRLFIPIQFRGETVSWTTRALAETQGPRYVNAAPEQEAVSARTLLFGDDLARHAVVCCEGPLDAMAVGCGAVATLGLRFTDAQVVRLAEFPSRIICFDAEPAAQRRAEELATRLESLPGRTFVYRLDSGKDCAEASKQEIQSIRRQFLD